MMENSNSMLCQKVDAKGFNPSHVAENGVWHPNTSNIYKYIQDGVRTALVEPDPESIRLIKKSSIIIKTYLCMSLQFVILMEK